MVAISRVFSSLKILPTADDFLRAKAEKNFPGARVVVSHSAGNGHAPVITIIPAGFDPKKPAIVQTHYHGDGSSAYNPSTARGAILRITKANPQCVFVLPEAGGNVNSAPTNWNNVTDQARTTRDALYDAGISNIGEKIVSGHSAGGRAIAIAANKPGGLDCTKLVLLDCLYTAAEASMAEGLKKNGAGITQMIVVRALTPKDATVDFMHAFKPRVKLYGMDDHFETVTRMMNGIPV